MPFIFEIEMCTKKRMQIYKICINYLLKFYKKRSKTLNKQKKKCTEQDRLQKEPDDRELLVGEKQQKVFCDITWEHPSE